MEVKSARIQAVTRYVSVIEAEVKCETCGTVFMIERAYAGRKRRYCQECARQRHNEVMRKQRERKAREAGRVPGERRGKFAGVPLVGEDW